MLRHPLVVVVEDDADMSRAMDSMLSAAGFETSMHASAEALLAIGVPTATTCLVLDVHLPGMSGLDLYEQLMTTMPHRPVVFMTAFDEAPSRERAKKARAVAYLVKPFDGKVLIATLRRVSQQE
jgi:FixJ family two-component response regulator